MFRTCRWWMLLWCGWWCASSNDLARGDERASPLSPPPSVRLPAPAVASRPAPPVATAPPARVAQRDAPLSSGGTLSPRPSATAADAAAPPPGIRRLRAYPRSAVPFTVESFQNTAGNEWITVIDRGVTLIIDGVAGHGQIDVSADRIVIWRGAGVQTDLTGQLGDDPQVPLELYMEGNMVFREGERIVQAQRMYYDVRQQLGTVIQAEVLTPIAELTGLVRLKADLVRQLGPDRFQAENAYVTSSRLARPGYRLQSGRLYFQDLQQPAVDPLSGAVASDAAGDALVDHERLVKSGNNFLFLGNVPVFYWPTFSSNLEDQGIYLRRIKVKNDSIFGTQVLTDWDAYQLLGVRRRPAGTDWVVSGDYFSQRGFGGGTTFRYNRERFLGLPGLANGFANGFIIDDQDVDNLGLDRRSVPLEANPRYRALWRHRQQLASNFQLTGEVGLISDRNFLEQYFEREWDEFKDQTTGIELKRLVDNRSWSITADARLNPFFTQTQWLPRADHHWLGQSLFGFLTWHEHSTVGYAQLQTASTPTNPVDLAKFQLLPWERSSAGVRATTRHALEAPVSLGPFRVVPFALGEYAFWQQDVNQQSVDRLYYQVGVRGSVPLWTANPEIESTLFNVHGIAHKMVLELEGSFADANRDLQRFPLYDPLDDDSIEHFRRRLQFNTFGAPGIPWQFDERSFALRSGLGGWVTSPVPELADDLFAVRMGLSNRWQTKRGAPGRRRIIDWMLLDTHATWFPRPGRDNFGEAFGLANYNYRWHVGDRTTILSHGFFDFFQQGLHLVNVGGFLNRPPRGGLYVGYTFLEGPDPAGVLTPLRSQVLNAYYSYRMSSKWVSAVGTSYDFGQRRNIGQQATITRIGESLLFSASLNIDASKGVTGFNFAIEPRFLPRSPLARIAGTQIPLAGAYGLE